MNARHYVDTSGAYLGAFLPSEDDDWSFVPDEAVQVSTPPSEGTQTWNFATGQWNASPVPVPASISDRQFAHELKSRGLFTQAEAKSFLQGQLPSALQTLIAALPAAQRDDAELLLIGATLFERSHPLTPVLAAGFGWTIAQTDQFFRDAAVR